jgi:hypothetical protein
MTTNAPDRYALRPTDRVRARAMRTHRTLLVSGALAPLALGASVIVHGDWRAALPVLAGLAGVTFLLCLTRLLVIDERRAWPAPSAARGRALARAAPAAEPRLEAAPSAVAPTRAARGRVPRARVSSTPS